MRTLLRLLSVLGFFPVVFGLSFYFFPLWFPSTCVQTGGWPPEKCTMPWSFISSSLAAVGVGLVYAGMLVVLHNMVVPWLQESWKEDKEKPLIFRPKAQGSGEVSLVGHGLKK